LADIWPTSVVGFIGVGCLLDCSDKKYSCDMFPPKVKVVRRSNGKIEFWYSKLTTLCNKDSISGAKLHTKENCSIVRNLRTIEQLKYNRLYARMSSMRTFLHPMREDFSLPLILCASSGNWQRCANQLAAGTSTG
jgi:hypothetical protein